MASASVAKASPGPARKMSRLAEWPDWNPPEEMIVRQPYLPRFMAGGEGNPLGARALYLGDTLYRIHGTNQPSTIGTFVSSGCIRLTNEDITDLYKRVKVGTRVVALSARSGGNAAARPTGSPRAAAELGGVPIQIHRDRSPRVRQLPPNRVQLTSSSSKRGVLPTRRRTGGRRRKSLTSARR